MRRGSLKVLIADNTPDDVRQLETLVRLSGHQAFAAGDGPTALDLFQAEAPDLVFMNVSMPGVDGLDAVRRIRVLDTGKWTPIIFLADEARMPDIVRGLEAGGDDYVLKPASVQLLQAKINAYARLLSLQCKEQDYIEELENWRMDAEEQNRLAAHVMVRLTESGCMRDKMVHAFNLPAETFSGDLLCAARTPAGLLYVLLADATGHGLCAALTALPITQTFYSMTAKGFPLPSIATELNRKLKSILPSDRFVAATMASVNVNNQTVELWNGGNPDALFVNREGKVIMQWASQHPPLGILPDSLFSSMTETVVFQEPGDLLLCSDGLVEAEDPDGRWLGLEGAAKLLVRERDSGARFQSILLGVESHLAGHAGRDDISLLMVSVPIERRQMFRLTQPKTHHQGGISEWRLRLQFSAAELRYLDVVPVVLGIMMQVSALKPHQGALFLIISELYNNALDHGLLGLDSAEKDTVGGFERYMRERNKRLAKLNQGHIAMDFQFHEEDGQAVLDIDVSDTGAGFDHERLQREAASPDEASRSHVRGIPLIKHLCAEVTYHGCGNRAWARFLV